MFNPSRDEVRRFFCATWRKVQAGTPVAGMEAMAAEMIAAHPEYHHLLVNEEEAVALEYTPEKGEMNPFLHLSLHLAIAEQLSINQPPGIVPAFEAIYRRTGDAHAAQHALLDCLGETIWAAQRSGQGMDAEAYLSCVRRQA
jgi:hypothetical protein